MRKTCTGIEQRSPFPELIFGPSTVTHNSQSKDYDIEEMDKNG